MATSRSLHIACALLLIGVVLLGQNQKGMAAMACPQYCLQVDYMTCPSSGSEKLQPRCNCCMAPKGCTLHLSVGLSRHALKEFRMGLSKQRKQHVAS